MNPDHATEVAAGLRVDARDDRVQTWWLCNEARRNAVSPDALRWIATRAATLNREVIVLRGAGGRSFCAGFDLTALATMSESESGAALPDHTLIQATAAMRRADATFIAALQGYAIGAGVELACACDLRLAERGIWMAIPAAELGVVYHAAGLANMRAVFGPAGTRRLLLLGDRLETEDINAAGALVRLVEPGEMDATLDEVLHRVCRAAPLATQGQRDLLRQLDAGPLDDAAIEQHEARRRAAYASEDHDEARQARAQGRPPRFRGR